METSATTRPRLALQVAGSPTSQFYYELSLLYAAPVVCPEGWQLTWAVATPSGHWKLGDSLQHLGPGLSLAEALRRLPAADVVVPHLFCPRGLTAYRDLFEHVLGYPLVGSPAATLVVAQRKHLTRLVAQAAGVRVADGVVVEANAPDAIAKVEAALPYPLIVKPDASDNSDGVSLVRSADALAQAIELAGTYSAEVLAEAYIPGREIRGAVVERDGQLQVLPYIEYGVSEAHPVRLAADKLLLDEEGAVVGQSRKEQVPAICPAPLESLLREQLDGIMRGMHRTLGCRDYSLYDFRIHAVTGEPYFLEAGLFWSFGAPSMISGMLAHTGDSLEAVTAEVWERVVRRHVRL